MKVREINSNTIYDLAITNKRGRMVLKGVGTSGVVLGCGAKKEHMLDQLNNCYVSRSNNLRFEEI